MLGLQVTFAQIVNLGAGPFGALLVIMTVTIAAGLLAARLSGQSPYAGLLAGGATAICGASAALALYSIAYQQALKLGRTADALTTIDAYTRRFSGTEFKDTYQATLWLRVRILCAKTFDDRCRQAAYAHRATGAPAAKVSEMITLAPR